MHEHGSTRVIRKGAIDAIRQYVQAQGGDAPPELTPSRTALRTAVAPARGE